MHKVILRRVSLSVLMAVTTAGHCGADATAQTTVPRYDPVPGSHRAGNQYS